MGTSCLKQPLSYKMVQPEMWNLDVHVLEPQEPQNQCPCCFYYLKVIMRKTNKKEVILDVIKPIKIISR